MRKYSNGQWSQETKSQLSKERAALAARIRQEKLANGSRCGRNRYFDFGYQWALEISREIKASIPFDWE